MLLPGFNNRSKFQSNATRNELTQNPNYAAFSRLNTISYHLLYLILSVSLFYYYRNALPCNKMNLNRELLTTAGNVAETVRFLCLSHSHPNEQITTMKSKLFMCSPHIKPSPTMKKPQNDFETSVRGVEWFMIWLQNYVISCMCALGLEWSHLLTSRTARFDFKH